jgi:uncharacterized membrane protein YeiH
MTGLIDVIDYGGTFVFALTGAFKARTHKMDIFGGVVLAFVTSYGGGTLRDLLIGRVPVNWINDYFALVLVFSATVLTFLVKENLANFEKTIFVTDAIGLGFFTCVGIEVALDKGLNDVYAAIMGIITATFGGLIADVLSNVVPNLLRRGELYATACAIGAGTYVLLKNFDFEYNTNLIVCIGIIVAVRVFSRYKNVRLPEI